MIWVLVGLGGAIGSMARHGVNHVIHQRALGSTFPLGVFVVNISGCVVMGIVAGMLSTGRWHWSIEARTFVAVGLLGGYTTFSSFSLDTIALVQNGHMLQAAVNVVGQVTLGLLAVWLGLQLAAA